MLCHKKREKGGLMRKWLYFLLVLFVARVLLGLSGNQARGTGSYFERIGRAVNIFIWVLCSFYLLAILYWFLSPEGK
jgi:hypothetical protein